MSTTQELSIDNNDGRLRVLFLYKMLLNRTNENRTLSTPQILKLMEAEHGITMHRTTLSRDIAILRGAGFNVASIRKRALHYYLVRGKRGRPKTKPVQKEMISSEA